MGASGHHEIPNDGGFALLIVAIAVAALTLIFAASLATARQHVAAADTTLTRTRLLAATEGAIVTAGYTLTTRNVRTEENLDITIGDVPVQVSVRPEAAKIDLNASSDEFLAGYFAAVGLSKSAARNLAKEIIERRTERGHAEDDADVRKGAKQGRFQSVSEIRDLSGVTVDLFECVAPDLTVFVGTNSIDSVHASARVKKAMGAPPVQDSAPGRGAGEMVVPGEIFEIAAHAHEISGSQSASRQTIVRLTGALRNPIWVLAQSTPAPNLAEADAACDRLQAAQKLAGIPR